VTNLIEPATAATAATAEDVALVRCTLSDCGCAQKLWPATATATCGLCRHSRRAHDRLTRAQLLQVHRRAAAEGLRCQCRCGGHWWSCGGRCRLEMCRLRSSHIDLRCVELTAALYLDLQRLQLRQLYCSHGQSQGRRLQHMQPRQIGASVCAVRPPGP
jgi:hypothetical protein